MLDVFNKFSFGDKITDLSSEDFYGLMLRLPELDFSYSTELSKSIYRIIEQPAFQRSLKNQIAKIGFFLKVRYWSNIKDSCSMFWQKMLIFLVQK